MKFEINEWNHHVVFCDTFNEWLNVLNWKILITKTNVFGMNYFKPYVKQKQDTYNTNIHKYKWPKKRMKNKKFDPLRIYFYISKKKQNHNNKGKKILYFLIIVVVILCYYIGRFKCLMKYIDCLDAASLLLLSSSNCFF